MRLPPAGLGNHLDRVHAERAGGLQVDAEIVEEHTGRRRHAQPGTGDLVDARVRLADAFDAGFHDQVEQRHDAVGFLLARECPGHGGTKARFHVVGDARYWKRFLAAPERLHHPWPHGSAQHLDDPPAGHGMAAGARLFLEQPVELVEAHRCGLEPCPGVRLGIPGVDRADEVLREPLFGFIAIEGIERRTGQHAAEIPDYGLDRVHL